MRTTTAIRSLLTAAALSVTATTLAPATPAHALEEPAYIWNEATGGMAVSGTYTPVVGDFAGPGLFADDVVWYAPGAGADHLWLNDATPMDPGFTTSVLPAVSGSYTPVVGDFSGTAHDDIFWYAPGNAADYLWTSDGDGTFTSTPKPVSGTYAPVTLDDGAGKDDIVWAKPGGGPGHVWSFEGMASHISTPMTSPAGSKPIVGRFNAGACADIFWYAPGAAADSLWHMNCAGTAGSVVPQAVNGTYQPVVEHLGPNGDALSDILWFANGTSHLWQSDGDGTWTTEVHDIPVAGTPLPTANNWGVVHIYAPAAADLVFWDTFGGNYVAPTLNTEHGAGWTPVIGDFVGFEADIFWYKAGSATERLFYEHA